MLSKILSLPSWMKGVIFVVFLGVSVAVGLNIYQSHQLAQAAEKQKEADELRKQAQEARAEAQKANSLANDLKTQLVKANQDLAKLRAANDAVHVLPSPGTAPEAKKQLIADLQGMGLELVLKPSTMIQPAAFGITDLDAKTVWNWGKQNLRIPSLEAKIKTQNDLIGGFADAKNIATAYAAQRTLEANQWHQAADKSQEESDKLGVVVKDTTKALKAERKKKYLYMIGAAVGGYFVHRELTGAR